MLLCNKVICIDFDGTVVKHEYPKIGPDVPFAVDSMKEMLRFGNKLILWTMRDSHELLDAVQWFKDREIELYGVQENPTQHRWTKSRKCYGNIFIDDAALGCPLVFPVTGRPYVDWLAVRDWFQRIKNG